MADETRQITYEGPAALAFLLVQSLKDEGVTADWTSPVDAPRDEPVVVNNAAAGASNAVVEGVRKFQENNRHGRVEVEEGEDG